MMMALVQELLYETLDDLEEEKLKRFKGHLKHCKSISHAELEKASATDTVDKMVERFAPEEALKITVNILRKMNQNHLAEQLENKHKEGRAEDSKTDHHDYRVISDRLKTHLKQEYERILDGDSLTGHQKYLNDIYTDLYMVENETGGVVSEHEVRQIEANLNRSPAEDTPIKCNDIFKTQSDTDRRNRKVLTMGIAGVGKTVSVNKFILDWAEGKENQDVICVFPLPFCQLNLIKDECSLMDLLHSYFISSAELQSLPKADGQVMFIFDGLDECRFPLRFDETERFTDVHKKTSISIIVTNLIRRNLVPSALIWITSRPAAGSLIPRDYIDQVTEVRGFNDEQKETYFKKNSNHDAAEKIISHIKKSRSLYIMCHIPIFCWMSVIVLQPLLAQKSHDKIPTTLTGMYINFLLSQKKQNIKKYSDHDFDCIVQKLGKLALKQLEKGNLIFYTEDLKKCGVDVSEGLVNSGLCTQIFQMEKVFSERKVYSFIHLSVQEFLAALYVIIQYKNNKTNPFHQTLTKKLKWKFYQNSLLSLNMAGIDKALQSKNGHLDLFLRFLLGLSIRSNQSFLEDLLPNLKLKAETMKDTVDYIKQKIEMEESVERTINLFHCLSEVEDDSLMEEIQKYMSSGCLSAQILSSAQWSALVFMLLMSEETQETFELQKYRRSDEGLKRLLPVIKSTRRALLHSCTLTEDSCSQLVSVLNSNSPLRDLDLSNNDLQDSGVKLLSDGLKSPNCKLKILRLRGCKFFAQSCESLASALQSSNSPLRDLDLSNNDLQDSGVKLISDALKNPNCQLKILRLSGCMVTEEGCCYLASALRPNPSHLRDLDLSNNDLQDSGVKLISDALKSPNCNLKILRLSGCMVTEEGCCYLASALRSNPSHLRELDLSYNHPGDSGVKLLSDRLNDPNCTMEILNVYHGGEFRITAGLKKYICDLTLDPNTVNPELSLSDGNRKVTRVREQQSYPDHPERFDACRQVLCRESLSGCCYWEAEWSGGRAYISVTYKEISRKGWSEDCEFGHNVKSWSLYCTDNRFNAYHNNKSTVIPAPSPPSHRVGVYLDWSAGTLSFYSVSDTHTLTHLHTFTSTFTEPLYAGFGVYHLNSSVSLCEIKQPLKTKQRDTQN